jgi:hypothetical protein
MATYRPGFEANETNETDFEEDLSDLEEYSGRRSEDSVSRSSTCAPTRHWTNVSTDGKA